VRSTRRAVPRRPLWSPRWCALASAVVCTCLSISVVLGIPAAVIASSAAGPNALAAPAPLGPVSARASGRATPTTIASAVRAVLDEASFPVVGLSVGVSRGDDVLFSGGFGVADMATKAAATAQTVYPISSMTKTFTAAAVMQLVQAGRLKLSDPLSRYVSGLAWAPKVTIAELLDHTSGIPDYINSRPSPLGSDCPAPSGSTARCAKLSPAQVVGWLAHQPLMFAPGTQWSYSSSNYYLLGLVIERATGQAYLSYLDAHVIAPLGLTHTGMCPASPRPPQFAVGYVPSSASPTVWANLGEGGIPASDGFAAGELCSDVGDLLNWGNALAHGRVVSAASYAEMTTPVRLANGTTSPYGFGLQLGGSQGGFIGEFGDHTYVGHTGGQPGFSSFIAHFTDQDLTIVLLFNSTLNQVEGGALPVGIVTALLAKVDPAVLNG
jgi:D-alanyl-D-alanine carboxypeptidase